ncbi:MAG: CCA tRNA nucleotidyltransferase [Lentisphaeria bacterium]|nr:CCA tRNA nucleotidyltransferase [Lentisphaeria bacterium]
MKRVAVQLPAGNEAFSKAVSIGTVLVRAGYETGIVGGAVRDLLLGKTPDDVDIVTVARPETLNGLFDDVKLVGASFGVSLVNSVEVAAARLERRYLDGRHPEEVKYADSLKEDMTRRDFTVNAMYLDLKSGEVYDHVGGLEDLKKGVIRTVGDPMQRFSEDYLRMLRAVRFAARFRFKLAPDTFRAIEQLAPCCKKLAGERVREELTKMFTGSNPAYALELLRTTGLLKVLLPEVDAMQGVTQPPEYHPEGDVYEHTLLMFRHLACADLRVAWSVLLHDIGKVATRSVEPSGRIRFFGHESVGADMAFELLERLHFSIADRDSIVSAIRNHMRFASVCDMRTAKLRKLLADENFPVELELHRLDCISCHAMMDCFVYLLDKLNEYADRLILPEPLINGNDLKKLGIAPGPVFRKILDAVFEAQLAGSVTTRGEALEKALLAAENMSPDKVQ